MLFRQSGTKEVDTLVENGCFYQTFNSFIIPSLLNAVSPLTPPSPPESMLSELKERLEGPKYNIDFWGYVHYTKRGHFTEVSQHFCPSLYLKAFYGQKAREIDFSTLATQYSIFPDHCSQIICTLIFGHVCFALFHFVLFCYIFH